MSNYLRFIILLILFFLVGCATTPQKSQVTFSQLSSEERHKYAEEQLYQQEISFKKAMNAFLHFMNENQSKWQFRIEKEFSVSIAGENHFSVQAGLAEPNSSLVSIGPILAIDRGRDMNVTMTSHGFIMLEHVKLGWSSSVTDWWKANIRGKEITNFFPPKNIPEFDELVENLDNAMGAFFNTYFGRANGILNETIRDHMLHNPLFF